MLCISAVYFQQPRENEESEKRFSTKIISLSTRFPLGSERRALRPAFARRSWRRFAPSRPVYQKRTPVHCELIFSLAPVPSAILLGSVRMAESDASVSRRLRALSAPALASPRITEFGDEVLRNGESFQFDRASHSARFIWPFSPRAVASSQFQSHRLSAESPDARKTHR